MDHPNVAKVFEAGSTPQGRPYFAMEYVQGVPINEHCDRHKLTNRERLELFMQVCEGVQHAHQKAIIHRDLKPSNALVSIQDGKAVPKIIDFGVAKAISQKLTERTLFTEQGQLVGTPEYMSPEQAEMTGQNVDTRTDVYSLGVMLYELLVGALPFDPKELRQAGFQGIVHKIREEEPPKPSTRLSTLGEQSTESARRRRVDVPTLQRQLRGDLDWITMKALEKHRMRRYGSPDELSQDIQRHLSCEPVLASPPSAAYQIGKFARRHRVAVGFSALLAVLVLGFAATFITMMMVQARRVAAERDRANQEAATATEALEFLVGIFALSDPGQARGGSITAREILDRGANEIDETLADQPEVRARIQSTIGDIYRKLGLYPQAEPLVEQALAEQKRTLGDNHADTLKTANNLALLYRDQGRFADAEPLLLDTLAAQKRLLGEDHEATLNTMTNLGLLYHDQGRYDEAEALQVATLEGRRRVLGDDHPGTLALMNNLANIFSDQGRYDEAESLYLETLAARKRVLGDDHPETLQSMNNLAVLYFDLGRLDDAERLQRETLAIKKRVLGDDHPSTLWSMHNLAILCRRQNRLAEAELLYLGALEARRAVLGDDHPDTLASMNGLAVLYKTLERYDEAEPLYVQALETRKRVLGEKHPRTLISMGNLALLFEAQGRHDDAETLYLETHEVTRDVRGVGHPDTLWTAARLADLYNATGRSEAARPFVVSLLAAKQSAASHSEASPEVKNDYAWTLLTCEPADLRDPVKALTVALELNQMTGFENAGFLDTLSLAYYLTGDRAKAIENQKQAIALVPAGDSGLRTALEESLARFEAEK
jgi:non-specific serine/threonine protein kinase/serine/threonine-protein kinase